MASARSYLRQTTAGLHQAFKIGFSGLGLRDRENDCVFLKVAEDAGPPRLPSQWDDRSRIPVLLTVIRDLGGDMARDSAKRALTPKSTRLAYG